MDTNEINVPECFNVVNELSRSPPQPKPDQLDEKCLADLRLVCQKPREQEYLGANENPRFRLRQN